MSSKKDAKGEVAIVPPCPVPPEVSTVTATLKAGLFSTLVVVFSPYLVYLGFKKKEMVRDVWLKSNRPSIKGFAEYQDPATVNSFWKTTIGSLYIDAVEYQIQEGYCGPATMRSILKSLISTGAIKAEDIPEQTRGPMTVAKFSARIDSVSKGNTSSRVVLGSAGYESFVQTLTLANHPQNRLAINFLRSPLFGAPGWFPMSFIKRFFGGHFSVIIGYDASKDLAAIWDVNAAYGGVYLVSSRRLYDAVNTFDLQSGECRGLVVVEVKN